VRRAGGQTGFTLIELTVALVAGLIVALGIVGLSREATRTFHEEVRSSAAEATLRTAVDRLRADLQRASYMSTPNIQADPRIAHVLGGALNVPSTAPAGILNLAGIRLLPGGSAGNTPLSGSQDPLLNPDAIEIGGNMTSADQFEVQSILPSGGCSRIKLTASSPAIFRVRAVGLKQDVELNNLFQPVAGGRFIVRLVDDTGRSQFLVTCNETPTAGFAAGNAFVDVDSVLTPILTPSNTGTLGGVTAAPSGRAWVNPVQVVHWELTLAGSEPAQYQNALGGQSLTPSVVDPAKYDLTRSYVDAASGQVIAASMEVIAEYAVDLGFAFSAETGLNAFQPAIVTYAFDNAAGRLWGGDITPGAPAADRPHRIRIVRARVATRAAQADRAVSVGAANVGAQTFLYRYCVDPAGCTTPDGTLRWARVRTLTTEVSLPNQSGVFYQ
jgi:prepilin-type N-terminal cleavage/methylation domain-containing protein